MAAPLGNKFALGNSGGHPPIYKDPKLLYDKCFNYFEDCIDNEEKPTITGLTLYLGFCSRNSLDDYADKEEFFHIIKRAKLTVENSYERAGKTIDIFALKNMGWTDTQQIELDGGIEIIRRIIK